MEQRMESTAAMPQQENIDGSRLDSPPPPPPYAREALAGPISATGETGVTTDGRIEIDLDSPLSKTLIRLVPDEPDKEEPQTSPQPNIPLEWNIPLNIVIQVVGSRGDVQPFVALGQALQKYGHRVRIATHNTFESFIHESKLEFYPIGGDPKELMAYMVKNPGLIPSMKSLREGDIQRKREMIAQILDGCWKSCIESDMTTQQPFVADAIIANPPSFAHVHCAQALGIPLHLMFTMPWSSTRAFPHPLANFKRGDTKATAVNYASYGIVEWLTWQGLGDVINKFRASLDLEEIPLSVGPVITAALKVPFTYCWSPALVPKPQDWLSHIDVCGFFFRDPPTYQPPDDIDQFIRAGSPPVYIGFGSIVLDNATNMTSLILEAVRSLGIRAIVSKGWSNLGGDSTAENKDVLFIGDCPHEWLFQHVAAVVHHGGAGTTACGLRNACPTVIVPFFGDQPFWGNMVAAAGAGPKPIPHKLLTSQSLLDAISFCLTPDASNAARSLSTQMASEQGVDAAVKSFHSNLPLYDQCAILPNSLASWTYKKASIRLSKLAAEILIAKGIISQHDLESHETAPIRIRNNRWDPVTGTSSAGIGVLSDMTIAAKNMVVEPFTEMKRMNTMSEYKGRAAIASKMASTTAKNFLEFTIAGIKGVVVDIPVASAEGFRSASKLYGEEPRNYGEVTDMASGFRVGAKTFAYGMADGFSDPFKIPYRVPKEEGRLGIAKGVGKGIAGLITKTSSAAIGIVAYPAEGIYKSIQHMVKSSTRETIKLHKIAEGQFLVQKGRLPDDEVRRVVEVFNQRAKANKAEK